MLIFVGVVAIESAARCKEMGLQGVFVKPAILWSSFYNVARLRAVDES